MLEEHPERKFKGRVVFAGNRVVDQNWEAALFSELSSSPATMEAAKSADAVGLFPGYCTELSDAPKAYTQTTLKGTPTWVSLPAEYQPAHWKEKYRDPVCPLRLALYGHPHSGGYWEEQCEK